jgi:hypothetical protein
MQEEQVRQLVRDALVRHMGLAAAPAGAAAPSQLPGHASHGRYALVTGGDSEGRCLIEPAVECVHCGYCLSHGH